MELSMLSPMINIGMPDADKVNEQGIPDGLGRGYLSVVNDLRGLLVPPDQAERESAWTIGWHYDFVDDRSSYASQLSWSASAKFGFTGGGASVRASMSRSYRSSMRKLHLIVNKWVHRKRVFLRDPRIREEAIALFRSNQREFIRRYGDKFIRSVTLGGLLSIVYELQFRSAEDASTFEASGGFSAGGFASSGSLHSKLMQSSDKVSITMQGICSGVVTAPPIFTGRQGVDKTTGKIAAKDKQADALVEYFDNFEESITDGSAVAIVWETEEISSAVNAPPGTIDLTSVQQKIDQALELDNVIDKRRSEVEYMRDAALAWNPQVDPNALSEMEQALVRMSGYLQEYVNQLVALAGEPEQPFGFDEIPQNPDHWILRQLIDQEKPLTREMNAKQRTFDGEARIPRLIDQSPLAVEFSASYQGSFIHNGRTYVDVMWVLQDNTTKPVFNRFVFRDRRHSVSPQRVVIPYAADLKAVRLVARENYGKLRFTLRVLA